MGAMHLLSILSAVFLIPHFKPLLFSTSLKANFSASLKDLCGKWLWWKNGFKITGE